jgi:hypothetical protein
MSCSANYYLKWNSRLDSTLQTETADLLQLRTIKKCRKISLC